MKKGYFFTLDAFISMSILVACIILVFSLQSSKPYPLQSIHISEDIMDVMATTKLYEINSPYLSTLYEAGNITELDNTILEQIAWFYISGRPALARRFTENLTSQLIPQRYGSELRIYNSTTTYLTTINPGTNSQESSRLIITSKRILLGIDNVTAWGPMTAEVRLWQ
jgi:hypothetical protein